MKTIFSQFTLKRRIKLIVYLALAFGTHFIFKVIFSKWLYKNSKFHQNPKNDEKEDPPLNYESDSNFSAKFALKKMILRFVEKHLSESRPGVRPPQN